jgi:hypothetical protein
VITLIGLLTSAPTQRAALRVLAADLTERSKAIESLRELLRGSTNSTTN